VSITILSVARPIRPSPLIATLIMASPSVGPPATRRGRRIRPHYLTVTSLAVSKMTAVTYDTDQSCLFDRDLVSGGGKNARILKISR
jgi:hypothetical protein